MMCACILRGKQAFAVYGYNKAMPTTTINAPRPGGEFQGWGHMAGRERERETFTFASCPFTGTWILREAA